MAFLVGGLFLATRQLRAQASPDFLPSDAREVTVHAENGIELQASFNGSAPIDVVFDTGSMNVISAALARKLGLTIAGTGQLDAGGGSVASKGTLIEKVQIAGVTLHHQIFAVIDVPPDQAVDFAFIGDEWLQHMPIEIDFDRQQITFYNPRWFIPPDKQPFAPVHFEENSVVAQGSVDGIPAMLLVDTGSIYSLYLNSRFVQAHDLKRRYLAAVHGYAGEGYGGVENGFYTRIDALQLASFTLHRPITVLLDDTAGVGTSHLAGTLGLRVLKHFQLLFDCPAGRLYVKPSANFSAHDIFNRAGLVIDPDPEQANIRMVFPKSPAARCGLAVGDVIKEIDGAPPTDSSLVRAFEQPLSTRIHLTVLRSGVVRTVSCRLSEVL